MLSVLNFVRGSVSKKDVVPILQNFHIYDGRIQGTNGRLTIDAPCPQLAGVNFTVAAELFLKAVDACQGEPQIKVVDGDHLQVSKGKFKVRLPLDRHEDFPIQTPEGNFGEDMGASLLVELKALNPFVGDDESKAWACGVLFRDGMAYATNNVAIVGIPAYRFPMELNLPSYAVEELLRLRLPIERFRATDRNVTFEFANGSWMKTSLLTATWPDIGYLIPQGEVGGINVGTDLINDIKKIVPFCPNPKNPVILFTGEAISTQDGAKNAIVGEHTLPRSAWRAEPLILALTHAAKMDFSLYPKPCPFSGDHGLRGVMLGVEL